MLLFVIHIRLELYCINIVVFVSYSMGIRLFFAYVAISTI